MDFSKLTDEQAAVVRHRDGPALVVAGAGTGKTYTLTARMAYLLEQGIAPENILVLTFTNAAANEMKKRAIKMAGKQAEKILACTYHSFCSKMLRRFNIMGYEATILDTHREEALIQMLKADQAKYQIKNFPKSPIIHDIFSASVNKHQSIGDVLLGSKYEKYRQHRLLLEELLAEFREYKAIHQLLGYDDLLEQMVRLLAVDAGPKLQKEFQYVMVDEAQDTNYLQLQMCRHLNQNMMFIGDAEQSIYGFRGSEVSHFTDFPKIWTGAKIYTLSKNFRSTEEILAIGNSVIENDDIEYKSILHSGLSLHGDRPRLITLYDKEDEVRYIFEIIKATEKKSDIAVIYRSNLSAAKVEAELVRRSMVYKKLGGTKFFDLSSVQDMIAFITAIVNPNDELSWFRVLQVYEEIGEKRAKDLARGGPEFLIKNEYTDKKTATAKKINANIERLRDMIAAVRKTRDIITAANIIRDHYLDVLSNNLKIITGKANIKESTIQQKEDAFESAKEYTEILITILHDFKSFTDFLDQIVLQATIPPNVVQKKNQPDKKSKEDAYEKAPETEEDDVVTLTTVHSAKGLEWNTVILMDAADGLFPNTGQACFRNNNYPEEQDAAIAEERRCMYVAVTRPKKRLYVLVPKCFQAGSEREWDGTVSRYLNDAKWSGLFH